MKDSPRLWFGTQPAREPWHPKPDQATYILHRRIGYAVDRIKASLTPMGKAFIALGAAAREAQGFEQMRDMFAVAVEANPPDVQAPTWPNFRFGSGGDS